MEKKLNSKKFASEQIIDEEIDLKIIFYLILRNKVFISITSLVTFFLALFYSFTLKKVWEGQFQIVLNSEKEIQISTVNPYLSDFLGNSGVSTLNTEVGILKSPSVLMPIYEFVNEKNGKDLDNKVPFLKWRSNNLDVELQKGTSILILLIETPIKK